LRRFKVHFGCKLKRHRLGHLQTFSW